MRHSFTGDLTCFFPQARADGEKRGRETAVEGLENEVGPSPPLQKTECRSFIESYCFRDLATIDGTNHAE